MEAELALWAVAFGRNIIGLVTRPYETMRRIVDRGKPGELTYIVLLLCLYFALASLVRVSHFRPFLLTREFLQLALAAATTYGLAVFMFWKAGTWVGAKGTFPGFALSWGYTLVPTLVWFLSTSILYVIIPPPRSTSPQGVLFSLLFLVFSATLFFWKVTLGYLALRFGLRLDFKKICIVVALSLPVLVGYSIGMYRIGIFRIPFV